MVEFLSSDPQALKQIYAAFPGEKRTTIRGRLNENVGKAFRRVGRGVYLAVAGDAKALVVEGDAWESLKQLDDDSIDAIITDVPYSCLNKHYRSGTSKPRNRARSVGFETRDVDPELLSHLFRVLRPGAHFFCFLPADAKDTLQYNNHFIEIAMNAGFEFNKRFIWDKLRIGMGYSGRNRYEQILFLSKGKRRLPRDLSIPDVLSHKSVHPNKRIHPAEKPVPLIKDLLRFCTNPGEVVLDPFAGSMVLARAGLETGRHTVSVEIDPVVIEKAVSREQSLFGLAAWL